MPLQHKPISTGKHRSLLQSLLSGVALVCLITFVAVSLASWFAVDRFVKASAAVADKQAAESVDRILSQQASYLATLTADVANSEAFRRSVSTSSNEQFLATAAKAELTWFTRRWILLQRPNGEWVGEHLEFTEVAATGVERLASDPATAAILPVSTPGGSDMVMTTSAPVGDTGAILHIGWSLGDPSSVTRIIVQNARIACLGFVFKNQPYSLVGEADCKSAWQSLAVEERDALTAAPLLRSAHILGLHDLNVRTGGTRADAKPATIDPDFGYIIGVRDDPLSQYRETLVTTLGILLVAVSVAGALASWLSWRVFKPQVTELAELVGQNPMAKNVVVPDINITEFRQIGNAYLDMRQNFHQAVHLRIEAEATVDKLHEDVRSAHSMKLEAVGRMLAGVAHDFNNHLAIITASIHSAQFDQSRADHHLATATESAYQASSVAAQLLSYSRHNPDEQKRIDIINTVSRFSKMLELTLGPRVNLVLDVAEVENKCCNLREGQFVAAMINLAKNARDAMENNGTFTLSIRDASREDIAKTPLHSGNYVILTFTDNGVGIATERIHHLFDPFFTTKNIGRGTGLGLAIVHGFVTGAGGHLRCESEVGKGTCFSMLLPTVSGTSMPSIVDSPHDLTEINILLAEDEPAVCIALAEQLRHSGATVHTAESNFEAKRILNAELIDVAILDKHLSDGDSSGLIERARIRKVPVIILSGWLESELMVSATLVKPVRFEVLAAAVLEANSQRKSIDSFAH